LLTTHPATHLPVFPGPNSTTACKDAVCSRPRRDSSRPSSFSPSAATSEIGPRKAQRADLSHPARRDSGLGFKGRHLEPQALNRRATRVESVRFDYVLNPSSSSGRLRGAPFQGSLAYRPLGSWALPGVARALPRAGITRPFGSTAMWSNPKSASRVARKIRGRIYEPSDQGMAGGVNEGPK
jgi:hypothetical protein